MTMVPSCVLFAPVAYFESDVVIQTPVLSRHSRVEAANREHAGRFIATRKHKPSQLNNKHRVLTYHSEEKIEDRLLKLGEGVKRKKQQLEMEKKKEMEKAMKKECTFTPEISSNSLAILQTSLTHPIEDYLQKWGKKGEIATHITRFESDVGLNNVVKAKEKSKQIDRKDVLNNYNLVLDFKRKALEKEKRLALEREKYFATVLKPKPSINPVSKILIETITSNTPQKPVSISNVEVLKRVRSGIISTSKSKNENLDSDSDDISSNSDNQSISSISSHVLQVSNALNIKLQQLDDRNDSNCDKKVPLLNLSNINN